MKLFAEQTGPAVVGMILLTLFAVALALAGCEGALPNGSNGATYTVTYDANDATSGSVPVDDAEYEEGEVVTVLLNSGGLARSGYAFSGWNTSADGSGSSYSPGDTFAMPAQSVTLYAQWDALSAPDYDLTGTWNGTLTESLTSGVCGENSPQTGTVLIVQNGTAITIQFSSGFTCSPAEACEFTGTVDGDTVSASNGGVADDSGGTYTSSFSLVVAADRNSASGTGASSYIGPGVECYWDTTLEITRSGSD